jgi:cytochrome c-type biogenesis protein CcmH
MIRALAFAVALLAGPAFAVQPDEMLADPALEERARELSKGLRCLVCRNESIDESHADLARDMRLLLRERIAGGDTDEEAVAFLVDRYGEYVLLQPTATGANLILWIAGPAMLLGGAAIAVTYLRRRAAAPAPAGDGLSDAEKSRLADLLRD